MGEFSIQSSRMFNFLSLEKDFKKNLKSVDICLLC